LINELDLYGIGITSIEPTGRLEKSLFQEGCINRMNHFSGNRHNWVSKEKRG
jgi:hypothetical protein